MKKRALLFVFFALLMLSIVPIVNLSLGNLRNTPIERWGSRAALYNVDFALPHVNRLFYSLGISTSPGKVVIGKSDWLYLGDDYENALSVMRNGATADDADTTSEIGVATKAWAEWFKLKNVRLFKVMIGPDKGTIYPEFLPDWVQPATHSATDMLIANTNPEIFLDIAAVLRNKKNQFSQPLYYRTDTHWNDLGAWIAFGALAADVDRKSVV